MFLHLRHPPRRKIVPFEDSMNLSQYLKAPFSTNLAILLLTRLRGRE